MTKDEVEYKFRYSIHHHRVTITADDFGINLENVGPRTAEFLRGLTDLANKAVRQSEQEVVEQQK